MLSVRGCHGCPQEEVTAQICVTVVGRDSESIRAARRAAEPDADLVELRLDAMVRPDPDGALAERLKPVIVTCRPLREGGMFEGSEDERIRILMRAHDLGAEFIDVEWDADVAALIGARGGRGVIVSRHDFSGLPADLAGTLAMLRSRGGEIAKLAVTTERPSDLLSLLNAIPGDGSSIVIGMGGAGMATRILADRFGSRWTYAGAAIAPGQITAARLQQEFRFRRIRPDAAIYMVIGHPVAGSLSPAMHNAGFAALGLNAAYVPLDVRDLDGLRAFGRAIGLRGASVTIPYKREVMQLLDEVAPTAAAAGAVNTLAIRDGGSNGRGSGRWIGLNTDADGFLEPLRARMPDLRGRRAVILGAGGAARGVGLALRREGAAVAIAARRPEAAAVVARAIGGETADWPPPSGSWDVLVNATPVGSRAVPGSPYEGPFDGALVYDLVYDPDPTELMTSAAAGGCTVIGGLAMLVAQAERQFEIWTGQRPPAGLFAEAAAMAIRARQM